jgi:4-hydroxybenzoyl-CoA thioesterase
MALTFSWPVRVYIEDTDAGGIVYYVNYLKFMERARTEALRSLGFGKQFIFDNEEMFVVHSMQVDYRAPARLDDELVVSADLIRRARTYLVFRQTVMRRDELLCAAEIKVACVARQNMKPAAIPGIIADRLAQLEANPPAIQS